MGAKEAMSRKLQTKNSCSKLPAFPSSKKTQNNKVVLHSHSFTSSNEIPSITGIARNKLRNIALCTGPWDFLSDQRVVTINISCHCVLEK